MIRRTLLISSLLFSSSALALDGIDLTKSSDIRKDFGLENYKSVFTMNFEDNGNPTSNTRLYKGETLGSEYDLYQVVIGRDDFDKQKKL